MGDVSAALVLSSLTYGLVLSISFASLDRVYQAYTEAILGNFILKITLLQPGRQHGEISGPSRQEDNGCPQNYGFLSVLNFGRTPGVMDRNGLIRPLKHGGNQAL